MNLPKFNHEPNSVVKLTLINSPAPVHVLYLIYLDKQEALILLNFHFWTECYCLDIFYYVIKTLYDFFRLHLQKLTKLKS